MEGFYVTTFDRCYNGFDRIQLDGTCRKTIECLAEMVAKHWLGGYCWYLDPKVLMLLFDYFIWYFAENQQLCHRTNLSFLREKGTYNASRINTIHALIRNIVHYTLGFFFVYALLSTIGVPVGSLLAGLDCWGGTGTRCSRLYEWSDHWFFIITEQQINVGDYIRLTNLSLEGTVTAVGIRTVQLKSVDGTVHYIPNRNITTISNTSRANMQVVVDVRILPSEGLDDIRSIIDEVNQTVAAAHEEEIQTKPAILVLSTLATIILRSGQRCMLPTELSGN